MNSKEIASKIFNINSEEEFNLVCLEIFKYQSANNKPFQEYIKHLNIKTENIDHFSKIPFLPIDFFKTQRVSCKSTDEIVFSSSGTTSDITSKHYVFDSNLYKQSIVAGFKQFYGNPSEFSFLALLPSYLEKNDSSLVFMINYLMSLSKNNHGFFIHNFKDLYKLLSKNELEKKKTILIGVSYALIDFSEKFDFSLQNTHIIETGGMKGKRQEMTKTELHNLLSKKFNTKYIHSEYGMTELLSQSYSAESGLFRSLSWKKILIRDINDPFSYLKNEITGGINVIDLANLYSCSFIETKDLGKTHSDGTFEVLGRFDNSDIRGCNLLYQNQ
ncbi:MAG: acyl transferase [Bacteroidetes bacterium GWA2_31_9]|nr:MAG: acyl transferase [Bacteroidetes bacterium GWA2_31_9]